MDRQDAVAWVLSACAIHLRQSQAKTLAALVRAALRCSAKRGRPFGGDRWRAQMVVTLGLASTMNPVGRPKKC